MWRHYDVIWRLKPNNYWKIVKFVFDKIFKTSGFHQVCGKGL